MFDDPSPSFISQRRKSISPPVLVQCVPNSNFPDDSLSGHVSEITILFWDVTPKKLQLPPLAIVFKFTRSKSINETKLWIFDKLTREDLSRRENRFTFSLLPPNVLSCERTTWRWEQNSRFGGVFRPNLIPDPLTQFCMYFVQLERANSGPPTCKLSPVNIQKNAELFRNVLQRCVIDVSPKNEQ